MLLPSYLIAIGFSAAQVGAIVFATLLGSAALTLAVGLLSHRVGRKRLLLGTCILMCATGIGFALSLIHDRRSAHRVAWRRKTKRRTREECGRLEKRIAERGQSRTPFPRYPLSTVRSYPFEGSRARSRAISTAAGPRL